MLIASPAAVLRRRWRRELAGKFDVHQVAQRGALVRSMARLRPCVLLLDLAVRRFEGLEDLPTIQRPSPRTKIVLLTSAPDEKEEVAAVKAGAKGYCDRDIAPSLLAKAVARVQNGEIWIGRRAISNFIEELASLVLRPAPALAPGTLSPLTSREREIAQLVGEGARNKEIAERLQVTEKTVKAHLTAVFRKLGLSSRSQLALFVAAEAGRRGSRGFAPAPVVARHDPPEVTGVRRRIG